VIATAGRLQRPIIATTTSWLLGSMAPWLHDSADTIPRSTLADGSGGDATTDDPNTVPPVFTRTPVTVVTATWASGT
jgi:hypothetical protein